MRKSILVILAAGLLSGLACGSNSIHWPGLVTGTEATDQITEAVTSGTLLCTVRTGRFTGSVLAQPLLRLNVQYYYGIDTGRTYKQHDIDKCTQTLITAIALTTDCNFATAPKCFLVPVNKVTGAH